MLIIIPLIQLSQWNKIWSSVFISPPAPRQSDPNSAMPKEAGVNKIKNDGLYFVSLSSEWGGGGLGEVCLDFLGHRGVSSVLNWSLSLFGFALATRSFCLQVINNSLYLRGFTPTWSGREKTRGEDMGHSSLDRNGHDSIFHNGQGQGLAFNAKLVLIIPMIYIAAEFSLIFSA